MGFQHGDIPAAGRKQSRSGQASKTSANNNSIEFTTQQNNASDMDNIPGEQWSAERRSEQ